MIERPPPVNGLIVSGALIFAALSLGGLLAALSRGQEALDLLDKLGSMLGVIVALIALAVSLLGGAAVEQGRQKDRQRLTQFPAWVTHSVLAVVAFAIGAVVLALVPLPGTNEVTAGSELPKSLPTTASPSPASSPAGVDFSFNEPTVTGPKNELKNKVRLTGTIRGQMAGNTLWFVSRDDTARDYFIVHGKPVHIVDDRWEVTASVGDTDDYGHTFDFTAIDANQNCREFLEWAVSQDPDYRLTDIPWPCDRLRPPARITLASK